MPTHARPDRAVARRPGRRLLTPAVVLALVAAAVVVPRRPADAAEPASQPAAGPAVGPIAYYVASCARCHGDISAAYVGVTTPKTGKALEKVIDDMAYGPAQAELDPEGLKQQTALHEAMFKKAPFVWIDPTPGTPTITGELLPGTTLTAEPAAAAPKVTGTRFELPRQKATLIATRDGQSVRVDVGQVP